MRVTAVANLTSSVSPTGHHNGTQVPPRERQQGSTGAARNEARQAPQRTLRQAGQEPPASYRDCLVGSATRGQQSPAQARQVGGENRTPGPSPSVFREGAMACSLNPTDVVTVRRHCC